MDERGNLVIGLPQGEVRLLTPVAYQMRGSQRQLVQVGYRLLEGNRIAFNVGDYDRTRAIVIDPTLSWSTYLGGMSWDSAEGVTTDTAGNVYVVGTTGGYNFPILGGLQNNQYGDVFVTKLSADGSQLLYSTYLGGTSIEYGKAIAVDAAGNAYVTGRTSSGNFPIQGGFDSSVTGYWSDAFVSKLSAAGNALVYSTLLGNSASESAKAIAVDSQGSAYVTGVTTYTYSPADFPTTSGAFQTTPGGGDADAFLSKLSPDGSTLVYSTYYGGDGYDEGNGITLTRNNDAIITGYTDSTDLPLASPIQATLGGSWDAFVARFNSTATSLVWATYLGGTSSDLGYAIDSDPSENVYITGLTESIDFPVFNEYQSTLGTGVTADTFLTRIKADGSTFTYSTYTGATDDTSEGRGIAVATDGSVWISGSGQEPSSSTGTDSFALHFSAAGTTLLNTETLGGTYSDSNTGIALDRDNNPILVGFTYSTDFPTQDPLYGTNSGSEDAFIAKILASPFAAITTITNDTGDSATDFVTNDTGLYLSGTATANATVTLYREGVGPIGTTTASAGGTWTYDYSGTALPEAVHAFKARATSSNVTGGWSQPKLITIDTTNPTVTLTMDSTTTSFAPTIRVVATDLHLPTTTTVTLDVNLNNDGDFLDTDETAYQTATLTNGLALFALAPAFTSTGTRKFQARVSDLAGNQGTSNLVTVTVNPTSSPWDATNATVATDALQGDATSLEGSLTLGHALDIDQSPGTLGYSLVYTSQTANAQPIVAVQVLSDNSQALPATITATLTWDTGGTPYVTSDVFDTTGYAPGDVFTLALQAPVVTTTGRYGWTLDISADYGSPVTDSLNGSSFVVSRDASIFGAGWSMAGVDQLIDIPADTGLSLPAGKLRVYGSGRWAFYTGTTTFTSPAGDAGTLAVDGGGWVYTSATNQKTYFDSNGLQTRMVSADGLSTTTFTYTGSDLTGIETPDGAVTTLTLNTGKVETITTGTRAVTLGYSTDDLVSITNPDNGVHTFGYDAYHKLTSEAFGSVQGTYAYDAYGLLSGTTSGVNTDAIRTELIPVAKLGLDILHAGTRSATTIDANNNSWYSELDSLGRVMSTLAPNGAYSSVTRDADGWMTSSTDPLGRTTTYTLDLKGFVTQVTNPDSSIRQYTYASNAYHSMLTSTNERGYTTTYGYDGLGHNTVIQNALNQRTTMAYHATYGLLETVRDARNNVTTYAYDSARRLETTQYPDGGTITLTYDANGNLETQTNQRGYTTTYTNDVMGRTTRVDHPDGSFATYAYDALGWNIASTDRGGVISTNTINTRGQVSKSTQGVGLSLERSNLVQFNALGQTSGSRDAMGYWSHAGYNANGQQTRTTDAVGNYRDTVYDLAGQMTQYRNELGQPVQQVYNSRGWLIESINANGQRATYAYDNVGNRTVAKDGIGGIVTTVYDALNRAYVVQTSATQLTTTTFDEVGNVWTRTDAANKTTTYTYDEVNRQKTITTPTNDTTTFNYDLAGNQTEVINARGKITTSVYDSMNRVIETITPDNESTYTDYLLSGAIEKITNARNEITTIVTDELFQTIGYINALGQQSNQILDALGRTVVNIDADGKLGTNWYDELGRSIGFLDGLGSSTREDYDAAGNRIRSVDANGNVTEYQYDNLGRLSVTIDPNGGRVTQTYDANGNLRTYTDPNGNTTTFTYDNQGREIQRTDALGNSLTYTYDSRNQLSSQTDRLGRRKDWTYDDNGRMLTETWFTGGSPVNTLTYSYDANGNLLTAADNDGTYTLTYDNQDRLWTQTGLFGVSLTFTYDELSRRNRIEDSFNGVMSSVYDAAGRLEKRQFGGAGQATLTYERDYSDNGELLAARRYSDLSSTNLIGSTTYGYDSVYRLTSLQHKDGSGSNIAAYTMTFDAGGRITEENRNGTSVTYTYDSRSQLTQAGATTYSYDSNGNRTMTGYATGGMNQLTNDGTFTYTYDLEGNVSTKSKGTGLEKWFYDYDHNNRLLNVRKTSDGTTNTLTVTYAYDVFGNRVKEDKWSATPGLVTTKFVYLGQEVYLDLDNSNAVLMRYIQGDTADEMIVRIDGSNNVAWFLADRLGSIRDIVDDTGTVIDSITYDAYGKITAETNSANRGNYAAFGYVFDSDTGFAIMPAGRPYSVDTGRFGGTDQLWDKGGLPNFYGYTGNNPTNATDPRPCLVNRRDP